MSLCMNQELFLKTLTASLFIMVSGMIEYGGEEINAGYAAKSLGTILFILGWLGILYLTGYKNGNFLMFPVITASIIIISMLVIAWSRNKYGWENTPKWCTMFYVTFAIGWVAFAYAISIGKPNIVLWFSLLASGMTIFSTMVLLPYQRPRCIVDGPGISLFVLTWVFVSIVNSIEK